MKIRTKPKAPKREQITHVVPVDYQTLSSILDSCRIYGESNGVYTPEETKELITYDNIEIEKEWDYDGEAIVAKFTIPQSEDLFNRRVKSYKQRLKLYTKWYKDNEYAINLELNQRLDVKKEVDIARTQKQIDKLSAQLARNQTKLRDMGG
jgi:hypothetical protein